MNPPKISVCIPVFATEPYLAQCLRSVIQQDFSDFEVVVVSDASRGKDEKGRNAKKITKLAQKECGKIRKQKKLPRVSFTFIENRENHGILEVRRTLVNAAKGTYIAMIDSDDVFEDGALTALFEASQSSENFDIVQGGSTAGIFDSEGNFSPTKENRYGKITIGTLTGHEIFHEWVMDGNITGVLWAKLIKRDLFFKAFENIPFTECNMAEDFMIFFFLGLNAKGYRGIETKVYRYRITSGVSSARKINSLHKWKMVCSAASVFTVVSEWIKDSAQGNAEEVLLPEEINAIRKKTMIYLANNLKQMHETVISELQEKARAMLCEYWGAGFVEKVEKLSSSANGVFPT